ncbi:MAG: right-handed parallel beta-helix repeat-containing protein [Candidatus Poseidoniales archaeon]
MTRRPSKAAWLIVSIFLFSSLAPILTSASVSGRAQTTWSGAQSITSDYTVAVTDELVITACTNVTIANGARIYVEGRLTIEGTNNCPVYFDSDGGQDHMGIVFNSTSNGRGSKIDNLSIVHSVYGITIYSSDPYLGNVSIYDPDDVGIDLFTGATPIIRDLLIAEAGKDWTFPSYWRYGIGLSIGDGSAPNVDGVVMTDITTRGLNFWGNSGGVYRNISIQGVNGATLAVAAGVWIEDSRPLIEFLEVNKSDHGVFIRHTDDGLRTRAVMRDVAIKNSMYKALVIDKADHLNYTNYQSAVIEGLEISGTGGPDAKTPGIATATIEINATGAWIEEALLEDNDAVGVQLYFVDSTTTFTNLTIDNSSGTGSGAAGAGISIRSSYFAAEFNGLEVSNSTGPGVFAISGGAIQGQDWNLHDNGAEGFKLESAASIVNGLQLTDNGDSGVHIDDARYVYLSNLSSSGNGDAGLEFSRANDIESSSGDVRCTTCSSTSDERGLVITDSVDLYLDGLEVHDPLNGSAIDVDNGGLTIGVQGGLFHIYDAEIWQNTSAPALVINQAEGEIDGLNMYGIHAGIVWDANHNVERTSILSNANLSGDGCLNLSNHDQLTGVGNTISSSCSGSLDFNAVILNWSGLTDQSSHVFNVDSSSQLHLHQPSNIAYSSANIQQNGWIEESWDLGIWVINNNSNGIPYSNVNLGFDQLENSISQSTNDYGTVDFLDLRGKKYTGSGQSPYTNVTIGCSYDGVSNTTSTTLDQDRIVWCHLPLSNQAPFLIWDTPDDQAIFPSHASIEFNASNSWDLDNDTMTFEWSSSLDGVFGLSAIVIVNDGSAFELVLEDGIHDITLKICDDKGNCAEETRAIELSNQPPNVAVQTNPGINPWGELHIPISKPLEFWLNGTYDLEGDEISCSWSWPSNTVQLSNCGNESGNLSFANMSQTNFDLVLSVDDGINPPSEWTAPVKLYNEMPNASFDVIRDANYSENEISLVSNSVDPEADDIAYRWTSNLDGVLSNESIWVGHLSRGTHQITLSVTDGRIEHLNSTSENTSLVVVENSLPKVVISSPNASGNFDSSQLFEFNSSGSGDYDSACFTFPTNITWHCAEDEPAAGSEWLIYSWQSDIDGILQENGNDWLIFETHLTSGIHTITLTMDDGINDPVSDSIIVEVAASAPALGLILPDTSKGYHSSDSIYVDISDSVDYDGDDFTFSLASNLLSEPLLEDMSAEATHVIKLPAGIHSLSFTLVDETGLSRTEIIQLTVVESDPQAAIYEPINGEYYAPGAEILLNSNGTTDADNDITKREWRLYVPGELNPIILSSDEHYPANLGPGSHHLSLYVEDRRGGSDELHINITSGWSSPDLSNLTVSDESFNIGELKLIVVGVQLDDPDGTTAWVEAKITLGLQNWGFNLSDGDGDGIWTGQIEINPNDIGRASLKVTAHDGDKIDTISAELKFEEIVEDKSSLIAVGGGIGGFIFLSLAIAFVVLRRRKRIADIDLIDNWGVFGSEEKTHLGDEELENTLLK